MADLPDVRLGARCPGAADGRPGSDARTDALAVLADGRADARGDTWCDARADRPGDGVTVLAVPPLTAGAEPAAPGGELVLAGEIPDAALGQPPSAVSVLLRHWAGGWWQSARRVAANPRGPYHAQPESLAAHDAYRRSRAWVPEGHEGRILGPAGNAYHHSFARFGMATGYLWAWIWAYPLRLIITAAVVGGIYLGFRLG